MNKNIEKWLKFGAVYGLIAGIVFVVLGIVGGALFGSILAQAQPNTSNLPVIGAMIGAAAGIVLLVVSVVMNAIQWGLASFVMPFVAKFIKPKFWNMVVSYSVIGAIISLISGSLGVMALVVSVITAAIFTWITMKFVKIKE